ncbi:MAG: DUF1700 domain-containing protein [Clostridiales bacterium]|nr:DUF1700 domain-containing protein [Clostridiales bacterium]
MNRTEFLDTLRRQLQGQMHEGKAAAHVRYYEDYIQSQVRGGRSEEEVLAELGDPRLIAKTLLDTDPDSADADYEEYSSEWREETEASAEKSGHRSFRLDLNTWIGRIIAILVLVIIICLVGRVLIAVLPFFIVLAVVLYVISIFRR